MQVYKEKGQVGQRDIQKVQLEEKKKNSKEFNIVAKAYAERAMERLK